jgi:hypothetical protein
MAYADTIRAASGVSIDTVAGLIEGALPARGALSDGTLRSQSGASAWVLVGSTGVAITLPNHCYVRQTISINFSHAAAIALCAFSGARDAAGNRAGEVYTSSRFADTGGLAYLASFECVWKLSPGTYTFYIAWWSADAALRYTQTTHNHVEAIREAAV